MSSYSTRSLPGIRFFLSAYPKCSDVMLKLRETLASLYISLSAEFISLYTWVVTLGSSEHVESRDNIADLYCVHWDSLLSSLIEPPAASKPAYLGSVDLLATWTASAQGPWPSINSRWKNALQSSSLRRLLPESLSSAAVLLYDTSVFFSLIVL